ncbi:uncharacterized protein VTP21DRAFT_3914 [Calcarisporiella thermophila]|uniref:uncharacterized protein n=1 Tax=Calcarisporiella thermophila TaxID=911321 RepID=UPI00374481FC
MVALNLHSATGLMKRLIVPFLSSPFESRDPMATTPPKRKLNAGENDSDDTPSKRFHLGNDARRRFAIVGRTPRKEAYESFLERLSTFKGSAWSTTPLKINPIECARHGWTSPEKDKLTCRECLAIIYLRFPEEWSGDLLDALAATYKKQLSTAHKESCLWRKSPEDISFYRFPLLASPVTVSNFVDVAKELIKSGQLPQIEHPLDQNQLHSAVKLLRLALHTTMAEPEAIPLERAALLALFGWQLEEASLRCDLCFCQHSYTVPSETHPEHSGEKEEQNEEGSTVEAQEQGRPSDEINGDHMEEDVDVGSDPHKEEASGDTNDRGKENVEIEKQEPEMGTAEPEEAQVSGTSNEGGPNAQAEGMSKEDSISVQDQDVDKESPAEEMVKDALGETVDPENQTREEQEEEKATDEAGEVKGETIKEEEKATPNLEGAEVEGKSKPSEPSESLTLVEGAMKTDTPVDEGEPAVEAQASSEDRSGKPNGTANKEHPPGVFRTTENTLKFDVIKAHYSYCPWVNAEYGVNVPREFAIPGTLASEDGAERLRQAGWQRTVDVIVHFVQQDEASLELRLESACKIARGEKPFSSMYNGISETSAAIQKLRSRLDAVRDKVEKPIGNSAPLDTSSSK